MMIIARGENNRGRRDNDSKNKWKLKPPKDGESTNEMALIHGREIGMLLETKVRKIIRFLIFVVALRRNINSFM
jgi:hypothetical protein